MWWPYSRDLLTRLPKLLAALPSAWGDITGVTVDATAWSAAPGRMAVANQVVRLHKAPASPHAPDRVVLLSPGLGRWDLQVIPPEATKEAAALLTATALDDGRPGAGGEAGPRLRRRRQGRAARWDPPGGEPAPLGGRSRRSTSGCAPAPRAQPALGPTRVIRPLLRETSS
ncbi:DUF5994 family protein [Streptomyces rochei]|uniref:DUF5994 family protein n=1 Tax=Streptomyces rochei TaxID=1928 RepID=UPI00364299C8